MTANVLFLITDGHPPSFFCTQRSPSCSSSSAPISLLPIRRWRQCISNVSRVGTVAWEQWWRSRIRAARSLPKHQHQKVTPPHIVPGAWRTATHLNGHHYPVWYCWQGWRLQTGSKICVSDRNVVFSTVMAAWNENKDHVARVHSSVCCRIERSGCLAPVRMSKDAHSVACWLRCEC